MQAFRALLDQLDRVNGTNAKVSALAEHFQQAEKADAAWALVLLLGKWLFDVPLRGTLMNVYVVSLVFIVANLALGLVASTIAQTQFQAMQMTFFVLLPSILLSGFIFPFDGMPRAAQWLAEVLPMTHY